MWRLWPFVWLLLQTYSAYGVPISADVEDGRVPPDLTPDQFKELKGTYLIKFFSPYCHHCTTFAPKWEAAYQDVGGAGTKGFKWANVDCSKWTDFCTEQGVTGYPSLKVYKDQRRLYDFGGGRERSDLRHFASKYIELGDAALAKEYETAPAEEKDLEKALKKEEEEAKKEQPSTTLQGVEISSTTLQGAETHLTTPQDVEATPVPTVDKATTDNSDAPKSDDAPKPEEATASTEESQNDSGVSRLSSSDFGERSDLGRWFVLFIGADCADCATLSDTWNEYKNFAGDFDKMKWGIFDCASDISVCESQQITAIPSIRVYENGASVYNYDGGRSSSDLRAFVKHASTVAGFKNFDLADLEKQDAVEQTQNNPAGPSEEPSYPEGAAVAPRPDYLGQGSKPKISEVVKYTLDTLGKPIDDDPGKLVFGESPEVNHNFRTWSSPDAPPPVILEPGTAASHANGEVKELGDDLETVVKKSNEPWLIKFYSPKCTFCVEMKPAYDDVAAQLKGKLNVGAVDCEKHGKLCTVEHIDQYPYISVYKGYTQLDKFVGERTSVNMLKYAERAWNSQIHQVDSEEDLINVIVQNMNSNFTTYLYLYDKSVMAEDWDSLSNIAVNLENFGGKVYRANSDKLRELAGIQHRGTAFVNVDYIGQDTAGKLKWYDFPFSNIPKKIRNVDEVTAWAYRAKYSIIQYLDPKAQTKFSPFVVVLLTAGKDLPSEDPYLPELKKISLEFRDQYRQRQIEDHDRMRVDRLKQHDFALLNSDYALAKKLIQQPIESPLSTDLAFAYIPKSLWDSQYSRYIDTTNHTIGNAIVVDFYHGVYLDKFNDIPIKGAVVVLNDSVELLRRYEYKHPKTNFNSVRFFRKSMSGIPKPRYRSTHFHSSVDNAEGLTLSGVVRWIIFISVAYFLYRKYGRSALRRLATNQNNNSSPSDPQTGTDPNIFFKSE